MKIEANVWQKVSGTPSVDIFPIIPKANCVSSNCYIFSAPEALVVVDPGASAEQTRQISRILTDALTVSQRPSSYFLPIAIKTTHRRRVLNFQRVRKSSASRTSRELRLSNTATPT
jgi:hypothetical protein